MSDIEHDQLRWRNQGAILANITEDYLQHGGISHNRLANYLMEAKEYLDRISPKDKGEAKKYCTVILRERGVISG